MIGDHHGRTTGNATLLVRAMDGILGTYSFRPHLSQDGEAWEFTSALIEEARDGSMYDLAEIGEQEARAIMERTRASYVPA
jgi:hypothetical protein